ncbi:MAG: LURP-one-related family protein [Ardenticatenaceae bacterium]|nr:LURP-one-related family protein [Ardenticatenaceae bacterium]
MRYRVRQKIWSVRDGFRIYDGQNQPVFQIIGKFFSWGDQLSFRDMNGREVAYISQRLLSFRPSYKIYRDGRYFADVTKEITFLKDRYTVDVPGPNDYTVKGDFWDWEYEFIRSGKRVAQVSKKLFSWSDTYGINIMDGEDDITILATAIVIDMVSHGEKEGD